MFYNLAYYIKKFIKKFINNFNLKLKHKTYTYIQYKNLKTG